MIEILPAFDGEQYKLSLVTYESPITGQLEETHGLKTYLIRSLLISHAQLVASRRDLILFYFDLLLIAFRELIVLLRERPDVVVSTGGEIALPIFWLAKLFRMRTIFIESLCRVHTFSATAKYVNPVTNQMLVQWPSLQGKLRKAQYRGNILKEPKAAHRNQTRDMVLVTVGTAPFPRLVRKMDDIAAKSEKKVMIQTAESDYKPHHAEYVEFVTPQEMIRLYDRAEVVVSHPGVGSIVTALAEGVPLVAVLRSKSKHEINSDHQFELGAELFKRHVISSFVTDINELENALNSVKPVDADSGTFEQDKLVAFLTKYIADLLDTKDTAKLL